jgi:hypothetical protein
VWDYVRAEDDRDERLRAAAEHGYSPADLVQLERTRAFMAAVYEAQKDYARYKAMAMLLVNQEDLYHAARNTDDLADKLSLHNALSRMTEIDKPAAGGGSGFVLNINVPGAEISLAQQLSPVTIENEPRLDPKPRPIEDTRGITDAVLADLDDV